MRRGFTLIELLIVIFLIGLLVAMAAPAIIQSRSAARRATCLNRQHELMLAVTSFEQAKGRFPGWREQLGAPGTWKSASWEFVLLPYLDRKDLYSQYAPGGASAADEPHEQVEFFICPEDEPGAATAQTSFGVNAGMQDGIDVSAPRAPKDSAANGVFQDNMLPTDRSRMSLVQFRLADLKDGARSTLALADRTEVVNWTDWQKEQRVALWWQNALDPPPAAKINGVKPPLSESKDLNHVRPSSGHPGGVVVSFADGHGQFLNEEIDYLVYALLMTPDGARARMPNGDPVLKEFRTSTIPEGTLGE